MSMKDWERRVLDNPGSAERVDEVERELRSAPGLTPIPGVTVVPSEFFDELVQDLDEPEPAPALVRAGERIRRNRRIQAPTDNS